MIKAIYACDFETTVDKDPSKQKETKCWSCAYAQLFSEDYGVYTNIKDFLNYFLYHNPNIDRKAKTKNQTIVMYYHNLRFDGSFILSYILQKGFKFNRVERPTQLKTREFNCIISTQNKWYLIQICYGQCILEIRDSLKLIPFKLADFNKAFNTKHQKLTMDYKNNNIVTEKNKDYILNDVFVLREGLEFMLNQGHDKLTIGANAIRDIKSRIKEKFQFENLLNAEYDEIFYDLKRIKLDEEFYGKPDAEKYIRQFYKGAFCYLKRGCELKEFKNGKTFDVNSLYPYVMHSSSGNYYGVNKWVRFHGGEPNWEKMKQEEMLYGVCIRCKFELKNGYIPTVQIKNQPRFYKGNEWLETSRIKYRGKFYDKFENPETHEIEEVKPILFLLKPDYILFMKHYYVYEIEYLHYFYVEGVKGMFDDYINEWMEIKMKSTGGMRTEAKLFLNNGYGKLAAKDDSSYLEPYLNDEKVLSFKPHMENNRMTVSILNGAFVTAYARYYTITSAQKCYDQFIYADTDSLHIIGETPNICVDAVKLGAWKLETEWNLGKFIRQKTYVECYDKEMKTEEEAKKYGMKKGDIFYNYPNITGCGMPDTCKDNYRKLYGNNISYFDYGLTLEGKLMPKMIKGGTVLVDSYFTLNK